MNAIVKRILELIRKLWTSDKCHFNQVAYALANAFLESDPERHLLKIEDALKQCAGQSFSEWVKKYFGDDVKIVELEPATIHESGREWPCLQCKTEAAQEVEAAAEIIARRDREIARLERRLEEVIRVHRVFKKKFVRTFMCRNERN